MKPHFRVEIAPDECKRCRRCVHACPRGVLSMGTELNILGFPSAQPVKDSCVGCGICFYSCPEPGAITIFREEEEEVGDAARK